MPSSPRVTVCIPTFNRARYLGGSIEAVLAQTFTDFKLIVADNASTDETSAVVERYSGDPRLQYVRRPENVGLLENHNLFFRSIETEYSLIVPDDDRLWPGLLDRTVAELDANPRAGMVHCGFDVIDADGAVVHPPTNWTYGLTGDVVEPGDLFLERSMLHSCRVCASTALMRTDALPPDHFRDDEFPPIDLGMWLRMALSWDMAFVAEPHASYRVHADSHSGAIGEAIGASFAHSWEQITALRDLKLRFLASHRGRFPEREWNRHIERAVRTELLASVSITTFPKRRLRPTVTALAAAARLHPPVLVDVRSWRYLVASTLGGSTTERIKARLRAGETA